MKDIPHCYPWHLPLWPLSWSDLVGSSGTDLHLQFSRCFWYCSFFVHLTGRGYSLLSPWAPENSSKVLWAIWEQTVPLWLQFFTSSQDTWGQVNGVAPAQPQSAWLKNERPNNGNSLLMGKKITPSIPRIKGLNDNPKEICTLQTPTQQLHSTSWGWKRARCFPVSFQRLFRSSLTWIPEINVELQGKNNQIINTVIS